MLSFGLFFVAALSLLGFASATPVPEHELAERATPQGANVGGLFTFATSGCRTTSNYPKISANGGAYLAAPYLQCVSVQAVQAKYTSADPNNTPVATSFQAVTNSSYQFTFFTDFGCRQNAYTPAQGPNTCSNSGGANQPGGNFIPGSFLVSSPFK